MQFSAIIRESDVTRGVQEGTFPDWFNNFMIKALFKDRGEVYFCAFLGFYWSLKVFVFYNEGLSMDYEMFKEILNSPKIP